MQGVGFRPFVYRLAHAHQLSGWVQNQVGQVQIWVQGPPAQLQAFAAALCQQAPKIAAPHLADCQPKEPIPLTDFQILPSAAASSPQIHIPVDYYTCADCLQEINDPQARRYHYPFTNCTQCGPRYTLIRRLPYDRPHTTLADFPLCAACQQEYQNPIDRRFHAQPLACPQCGPQLSWHDQRENLSAEAALNAAVHALQAGKIIAVKGIGGYHLMVDAACTPAIQHLRQRKGRPDKPLAVLFPTQGPDELEAMRGWVQLTALEADLLRSPQRPIVLAMAQQRPGLSPAIAPKLQELGVMLPYSPLHYLLLAQMQRPLVATSANISGEPVLTDNAEVEQRLKTVADGFLHHNRPIARPADDPVFRQIDGQMQPVRLGRGGSPLELDLPFTLDCATLAVGGQMKATLALAWGQRVVISPHIGDLDSVRSQTIWAQVASDLQRLYQVQAQRVICDAHPGYASHRWAKTSGLPWQAVYHHAAHASALAMEHWNPVPWLVFTWDGVGYGPDGTLWGGEALMGQAGHWQRFASVRPFVLPGGDKASREPWRSAASLCWEAGVEWPDCPVESGLLRQAWQQRINCPLTSSMGRLFDAAASWLGLVANASYEGQGPMQLEQISLSPLLPAEPLPLAVDAAGVWRLDWKPLIAGLLTPSRPIAERAAWFHSVLAHSLLNIALQARTLHHIEQIGLTGGVFQNRKLTEYSAQLLRGHGFQVALPKRIPGNDGGLSLGQIVEAACQMQTA